MTGASVQTVIADGQLAGLALVAALAAKHFVADFLLQSDRIIREKGLYGRLGGIIHVLWHGGMSLLVLMLFGLPPRVALVLSLTEMVVHYHIDYAKDAVSRRLRDTPADRRYWATFGFDQLLHHLTYVAMVAIALHLAI